MFTSFAIGTILVVAVAMLGSLTVLPAVLSKLGDSVEKGRVPFLGTMRHRNGGESRVWGWILDRVLRHPVLALVLAGGAAGRPRDPRARHEHGNARPEAPAAGHLPVMQTYDRIQAAFPGGPQPAVVVVAGRRRHDARGPGRDRAD